MAASQSTSVYLYFDTENVLIYVGVTSRGVRRQREHEKNKPWWEFAHHQEIEHFKSREAALNRESELISTFRPPFNGQQNPDKSLRGAYMELARGNYSVTAAPGNRIPLDVVTSDGMDLYCVSRLGYARFTSDLHPDGQFVTQVEGAKARDVRVKKLGSSVAVRLRVTRPVTCTRGELMFRNDPRRKDIKRIDLFN